MQDALEQRSSVHHALELAQAKGAVLHALWESRSSSESLSGCSLDSWKQLPEAWGSDLWNPAGNEGNTHNQI